MAVRLGATRDCEWVTADWMRKRKLWMRACRGKSQ